MKKERILVTGAGGFIGHHLVRFLKKKGYFVRAADIKYPEYSPKNEADEFMKIDLRELKNCLKATQGMDKVYTLAANMGGVGYLTEVQADVIRDNILINVNIAEACKQNKVKRVFYSSSACIYPTSMQENAKIVGLKESDAYPALPDQGYGWEKLFAEIAFQSYAIDHGLDVRIARFHNIYGPEGTYDGGKEKAPAALSRKVAKAKDGSTVEVWGDGKQTRSFCYVDDCIEGVYRLMESNVKEPLNIGSDRLVDMNEMIKIISKPAGKKLNIKHLLDKPQGVRGRNSDNTLCKKLLKWEPKISLEEGLEKTYFWIKSEIEREAAKAKKKATPYKTKRVAKKK